MLWMRTSRAESSVCLSVCLSCPPPASLSVRLGSGRPPPRCLSGRLLAFLIRHFDGTLMERFSSSLPDPTHPESLVLPPFSSVCGEALSLEGVTCPGVCSSRGLAGLPDPGVPMPTSPTGVPCMGPRPSRTSAQGPAH